MWREFFVSSDYAESLISKFIFINANLLCYCYETGITPISFPLWKDIFWLELCSSSSSYSSSRSFFTANLISEGIESKWHQHIWIDHLIFSVQQNIYHFIVCIIRWNSMPVNEIITTSRRAATLDVLYWKRLTDFYFVEQTLSR